MGTPSLSYANLNHSLPLTWGPRPALLVKMSMYHGPEECPYPLNSSSYHIIYHRIIHYFRLLVFYLYWSRERIGTRYPFLGQLWMAGRVFMQCCDKNSGAALNLVRMCIMIDLRHLPQGQAETRAVYVPCICHPCFGVSPSKLYRRRHSTHLLDLPMLWETRYSNIYLLTV